MRLLAAMLLTLPALAVAAADEVTIHVAVDADVAPVDDVPIAAGLPGTPYPLYDSGGPLPRVRATGASIGAHAADLRVAGEWATLTGMPPGDTGFFVEYAKTPATPGSARVWNVVVRNLTNVPSVDLAGTWEPVGYATSCTGALLCHFRVAGALTLRGHVGGGSVALDGTLFDAYCARGDFPGERPEPCP